MKTSLSVNINQPGARYDDRPEALARSSILAINSKYEQYLPPLKNMPSTKKQLLPLAELCRVGAVIAGFLIISGTTMILLYFFWESREGFTSIAEHYNIKMDIVGYVFLAIAGSISITIGIIYFIVRAINIVDMANKYSQQQECLQGLCAHEELLRQSFRMRSENGRIAESDIQILSLKYFDEKDSSAF